MIQKEIKKESLDYLKSGNLWHFLNGLKVVRWEHKKGYKKDTTLDCALLCYIFKNNGVIKK